MDKVHGNTIKAADIAIAKKQISPASHWAVLAGEISLQDARELGRSGTPEGTLTGAEVQEEGTETSGTATDAPDQAGPRLTSRISKNDHTPTKTPCLCGCGKLVGSRFAAGHDMRMFRVAREHLDQGRELTDEQREYLETSGKMRRVRDKIAGEDAKRQERASKAKAKAKDAK